MPSYTDPYTPIRIIERDIRELTGKSITFLYEKDDKNRTVVRVSYRKKKGKKVEVIPLTTFLSLDDAVEYAKTMVNYYAYQHGASSPN